MIKLIETGRVYYLSFFIFKDLFKNINIILFINKNSYIWRR